MGTAIQVARTGGPEVLEAAQVDVGRPAAGQLVVDVAAAGVNFIDTYQRSGVYPMELPAVLGSEGAGVVTAVGKSVDGFAVGDVVAWPQQLGSYCETMTIRAAGAVLVPQDVDVRIAAAVMLQGLTAHYLTASTYPVGEGDAVLVHAAAGGAGALIVQLAKARGARVLATASTAAKRAIAHDAGADVVVDYTDVAEAAQEFTDGVGLHAVYDGVGKATFDTSLEALRPRGYLVLFGGSSGQVPPVDPQRLNRGGSLFLTRPTLGHYIATPEELAWRAGEVLDAVARGELTVRVGGTYPLVDAAQAHTDLEARRTTGKLLLLP